MSPAPAKFALPMMLIALFAPRASADAPSFVKPVAVDGLVQCPAEYFDLQGKTIRFTPHADGSYFVQAIDGANLVSGGRTLEDPAAIGPWYSKGWEVKLPFLFPFAGKKWDR